MRQISKQIWTPDQNDDADYETHYEGGKGYCDPEDLAALTNMDYRFKDPKTGIIMSSQMFHEKFGSMENLAEALKTSLKTGIDPKSAAERAEVFGKNAFSPPRLRTLWELVMENFKDFINQVLLAAAIVSVIIGEIQHPMTAKGLLEGTSIAVALTIIIVVTSANNYISEKRLADLVAMADKQTVPVLRGSDAPATIDATELVVGDVVKIKMGDKVPADCLVIESQDLSCIEADLTGEPDALLKGVVTESNWDDKLTTCTLLAKSLVQTGTGTVLVNAVGLRTAAGAIDANLNERDEDEDNETHLQKKLGTIANKIGNVGWAVAGLTLAGQLLRLGLEYDQMWVPCGCMNITTCRELQDAETCEPLDLGKSRIYSEFLSVVIVAITVVVVAIPEGLPLAVTISLSFSSAKMRALHNLVRTLAAAETMGGATHICSDKTGTLTQNRMTVMGVATLGNVKFVDIVGGLKDFKGTTKQVCDKCTGKNLGPTPNAGSVWDGLVEQIMWNTDVFVQKNDGKDSKETEEMMLVGNVTEKGLITFFKHSIDYSGISSQQDLLKSQKLADVAFTSSRKRATVVIQKPNKSGACDEVRVYTKGAPDVLFEMCSQIVNSDGEVVPIDSSTRADSQLWALKGMPDLTQASGNTTHMDCLERTVKLFASRAYRTILLTFKDMSKADYDQLERAHNNFAKDIDREEAFEHHLTAYALFGLQDPLRDAIIGSIKQCHSSQIRVIMCTGDNIDTASAISKEAGILKEEDPSKEPSPYAAMVGQAFRKEVGTRVKDEKTGAMKDEVDVKRFKKLGFARVLSVLARSSPLDKYLLVSGIQACGGVVAVTGDGTNDAPALKRADVGFAMGQTGTDVAKGASDIILLDDNFASIVVALRYGRNVYDNVRKFLQFQLTVNVVAMFIVFFGSVILKDSPLTAVQMLWVNMIMDTFAALALATEPPEEDILQRAPYHKDAPIVTDVMWRNVHGHAVYQIIIICFVIFFGQGSLCYNYDQECLDSNDDGSCQYNPFYSYHHYYQDATYQYWEGKVVDCGLMVEAWAALDETFDELRQGEVLAKCEADYPDSKQAPWLADPDAMFNGAALAEFNCMMAEEKWPADWEAFVASSGIVCTDLGSIHDNMPGYIADHRDADEATTHRAFAQDMGQLLYPWDQEESSYTQKALHFTYVFQIFVFMQVFNQINARKLKENEMNVFAGMCDNIWFNVITVLTFGVQMAMVQVGGQTMKVHALTLAQNGVCIGIGCGELIWGLVLKQLPLKWFQCVSMGDDPMSDEDKARSFVSSLKPSMAGRKDKQGGKGKGAKGSDKFQREK